MSTNEWNDDDDEYGLDEERDQTGPKALRAALRKEKEQRKALEEQLGKIQRDLRQRTVGDVLNSKGVSPKLAKFVLADLDEVNEDNVAKWLDENGELFNIQPSGDSGSTVDVGEVADFQRAQQAAQGSAPQPTADQMAKIQNATTREDLAKAMAEAGLA